MASLLMAVQVHQFRIQESIHDMRLALCRCVPWRTILIFLGMKGRERKDCPMFFDWRRYGRMYENDTGGSLTFRYHTRRRRG